MDLGVYLSGLPAHAGPMACVFLAAFLQSITGFGLVMVAAPLLMFFYEPKLTIVIMFFLAACGNSTQLAGACLWNCIGTQGVSFYASAADTESDYYSVICGLFL